MAKKKTEKKLAVTPNQKAIDNLAVLAVEEDRTSMTLRHMVTTYEMPVIDIGNIDHLEERTEWYFSQCMIDKVKPGLAGLCAALGINTTTFKIWLAGGGQSRKHSEFAQKVSGVLELAMEAFLTGGQVNPAAGIFMMKNHFGYQDQTAVVVQVDNLLGEQRDPDEIRRRYLASMKEVKDVDGE